MTRSLPTLMILAVAGLGLLLGSATSAERPRALGTNEDEQKKSFTGKVVDLHAFLTKEDEAGDDEAEDSADRPRPGRDLGDRRGSDGPLGLHVEDPGLLDRITGDESHKAYVLLFEDRRMARTVRRHLGEKVAIEGTLHERDGLSGILVGSIAEPDEDEDDGNGEDDEEGEES